MVVPRGARVGHRRGFERTPRRSKADGGFLLRCRRILDRFIFAEALLGLFVILSLYLLLEVFRRRVRLADEGVEIQRCILGQVQIPWSGIESVRYSDFWKVLKIYPRKGSCHWIDAQMNGLATLRVYLARYAAGVADTPARAVMPRGAKVRTPLPGGRYR